MAASLSLQLFASLVVRWQGKDITRSIGQPAAQLLACLALHPRPLSRSEIAGLLWPEGDGQVSLRQALHKLKAVCGEAFIASLDTSGGLKLSRTIVSCDLWEWERQLKRAQATRRPGTWKAVCAPLSAGLFTGKGEDWLDTLRPKWNRKFAEALRQHAAFIQSVDVSAAEASLRRALELSPMAEATVRELMTLLAVTGRREEVRAVYEALSKALYPRSATAETRALTERLQNSPAAVSKSAPFPPRPAPPAPLTRLLTRSDAMESIHRRLDSSRLVQLVGIGGMGKTRLALETLRVQAARWADGGAFVELSTLPAGATPDDIVVRLARALGLDSMASAASALYRRLQSAQLLLVLDNAEHVREAVATLVRELLVTCPEITILVTTREPLGLFSDEEVYAVPDLRNEEAEALFALRAPDTPRDDPNLPVLVRMLHGIPLAVELAAARARELGSLNVLRGRLESDFGFQELQRSYRATTPDERRHHTLEAMLRWSFSLLTPREQGLFLALGAFRGGASLTALATVASQSLTATRRGVAQLRKASLITQTGERSILLELVRQVAIGLAQEQAQLALLQKRHRDWFAEQVRALAGKVSDEADDENLTLALEGAIAHKETSTAFPLAAALWPRWRARGGIARGVALLDCVLPLLEAPGELWMGRGILNAVLGRFPQAESDMDEAERRYQAAGEIQKVPALLANRGNLALDQGKLQEGEKYFTDAYTRFLSQGDAIRAAMALGSLGRIALRRGDFVRAAQHHTEAHEALLTQGERTAALLEANNLAFALLQQNLLEQARVRIQRTWIEAKELGNLRATLHALALGVQRAERAREWVLAAHLIGATESLIEQSGLPLPASARATWEQALHKTQQALGEARFNTLRQEGSTLSQEQAGSLL